MKIQILISEDSWANDYINYIKKRLKKKIYQNNFFR